MKLDSVPEQLLYGDLMEVTSPHLIHRYNSALKLLTGKTTQLSFFHIDCSGYSPEIATELDTPDYLDDAGANPKFILLSIEQQDLPSLSEYFSSTSDLLKRFINDNYLALFTLTALDAVYGELDNRLYRIQSIEDIINVDEVHFQIDTPKQLISQALNLQQMIDQLLNEDDQLWLDDEYLQSIIQLGKTVGNVQLNKVIPDTLSYQQNNYFTSHMGGIYVFKDTRPKPTLITLDPQFATDKLPNHCKHIHGHEYQKVFQFLIKYGLIEPLQKKKLQQKVDQLRFKKHQVIIDYLISLDQHCDKPLDEFQLKQFINQNFEDLPESFHKLHDLVAAIERQEKTIPNKDELLFHTCQVTNSPRAQQSYRTINHLLSHYTPYNYLRLFIFNRPYFNAAFSRWPEAKQQYVMDYLRQHQAMIEEKQGIGIVKGK
ncbi:DUF6638 family protein [Spartinivicinus ruber]|uniref:DUF6638 family protein n=1 Tax=Spartinivicinus ruber TaxID=2683272 RepID=UPI0013D2297C|nr:DUF6638 family protein [Spartinivicinus ruber]